LKIGKYFLKFPLNVLIQAPIAVLCQKYINVYYLKEERKRVHNPEQANWYDNRISLFRWPFHLDPVFAEKGFYSRSVLKPGCSVLDIGSGGGFYPFYFYAKIASLIDCIDIDEGAIKHAKRYHSRPNIRYLLLDAIRDPFPEKNMM
jgi:SAM-dependent methyltransferase